MPLLGHALSEAGKTLLHVVKPRVKAGLKGRIDEGGADDSGYDLLKVGDSFERVSNGVIVRIWKGRDQPVMQGSVEMDVVLQVRLGHFGEGRLATVYTDPCTLSFLEAA